MKKIALIGLCLIIFASPVNAAQLINISNNTEIRAKMGRYDVNRLHLVNDQIIEVYANKGDLTYSRSENTGRATSQTRTVIQENLPSSHHHLGRSLTSVGMTDNRSK